MQTEPVKQPKRSKSLLALFFPILLTTFTNYVFLLIEKVFFANFSPMALQAAVPATYVCQLFQLPTIIVAMMAQIFVGHWYGAGGQELKKIGPGVWQFIWFSLFSMAITFPLTWIYGQFYFANTEIEALVTPYYRFLAAINFLYPLTTALSCFYLAQSRIRLVLWSTVGSQLIKIGTAFLFIFGKGDIPTYGIIGGAVSTLIAQLFLLVPLFIGFIKTEGIDAHKWHFQFGLFWECMRSGMLRAGNRILNLASWTSVTHLVTNKGDEYLAVLSIGGAIYLFLPFLSDALLETQITVIAQIIGKRAYRLLLKAFNSATVLASFSLLICAIPLVIFPLETIHALFPKHHLSDYCTYMLSCGLWLSFALYTLSTVPLSRILALKDMKFIFYVGVFSWVNGFLASYIAIVVLQCGPEYFWFVNCFWQGTTCLAYYFRMRWLDKKISEVGFHRYNWAAA